MARKIIVKDADTDKFGILVTYEDSRSGWIVGPDGDYLLFDAEPAATKALKKMKSDKRYSWNCRVEVSRFHKL